MPCRDYDENVRIVDNTRTYQEQRDKLARIACRAMTALEKFGRLDLVADKESADWFKQHKIADAKAEAEAEKREARQKVVREEKATLLRLKKKYEGGF
jgi:hypothetical protein